MCIHAFTFAHTQMILYTTHLILFLTPVNMTATPKLLVNWKCNCNIKMRLAKDSFALSLKPIFRSLVDEATNAECILYYNEHSSLHP